MIGLLNIKDDLRRSLDVGPFVDLDKTAPNDLDGIYIDWVPKSNKNRYLRQALVIEMYVKKKRPIVIFDRFFSLTYKEFLWLSKFNSFFFEPAVNFRRGFDYMPQWTDGKVGTWDEDKKSIDMAYQNDNLNECIATLEKYYRNYSSLFPDKIVRYSGGINTAKKKQYSDVSEMEHIPELDWGDVKYTVLIGSKTEYRVGYLRDDLFDIMKKGVLPLLPIEHRFFGSMFNGLVVKDVQDVDYYISLFGKVKTEVIEDIFDNMKKYNPEFDIKFTTERITSCFV